MITFIGDVHGWLDRLEAILEQEPDGPYVFLGDLIDRGPDSQGVVERVRALCAAGRARCVMGNHEYALVKGLGCAELGIPPSPEFYAAWVGVYGAQATLASYAVDDPDPEVLRRALGPHLAFLAGLPWVATGSCGNDGAMRRWVAVHAGLQAEEPWADQVAALRELPRRWYVTRSLAHPPPLYDKGLVEVVPEDLPADVTVVSGHTPQAAVVRLPGRIVCDTSGGRAGRRLSAVRWPTGTVYTAS